MVVTRRLATADTGVMHDRTGWPSTWTVHAPHWATPQPNLVPVRPSFSRSAHSSGMSGSASTVLLAPLTSSEIMMNLLAASLPRVRRLYAALEHSNLSANREVRKQSLV